MPVNSTKHILNRLRSLCEKRPTRKRNRVRSAAQAEVMEDRVLLAGDVAYGFGQLADLNPGPGSSSPREFTSFGDLTFFNSNNDLWVTDGTQPGTIQLTNARVNPTYLTVAGDTLFFSGSDSRGRELWKSDGTPEGTTLVRDINAGADSSRPENLTFFKNKLYFSAYNSVYGEELWSSDGTLSGTNLVRDIQPGPSGYTVIGSSSAAFPILKDEIFFSASLGPFSDRIFKSDGTSAGTVAVTVDPYPTSAVRAEFVQTGETDQPTILNGELYFKLQWDLWKTDGTAQGTTRFITPGKVSSAETIAFNGAVYFSVDGELWKTDGTQAGTLQVYDFPGTYEYTDFEEICGPPGCYLEEVTRTAGRALRPSLFFEINGNLLFEGSANGLPQQGMDRELFTTDGTQTGTHVLKELTPGSDLSVGVYSPISTPDKTRGYFLSQSEVLVRGSYAYDLYQTDGTADGTIRLNLPPATSGVAATMSFSRDRVYLGLRSEAGIEPHILVALPQADAGTYAPFFEGTESILDGSQTIDLENAIVSYQWDFNYDGMQFDIDAMGVSVPFTPDDGPFAGTIALRVEDRWGNVDIATVNFDVENLPPVISGLTDQSAVLGQPILIAPLVTDLGSSDTFTYHWDLGNGTIIKDAASVTHTYADEGEYFASLTVTDNDGGVTRNDFRVVIGPPVYFGTGDLVLEEGNGLVAIAARIDQAQAEDVVIPLAFEGKASLADFQLYRDDLGTELTSEIVITAGSTTATVYLRAQDDQLDEDDELLTLVMQVPSNASLGSPSRLSVTLLDDDPLPGFTIDSGFALIPESVGQTSVVATLSEISGRDIEIAFDVSGSAAAGDDYTLQNSSIHIPAGQLSGAVIIQVNDDEIGEPLETIIFSNFTSAQAAINANPDAITSTTFLIAASDIPRVSLDAALRIVSETVGTAEAKVSLSNPSANQVVVPFSVSGNAMTGEDFSVAASSPLVFAPGETEKTLSFQISDDSDVEDDESIVIDLQQPSNALFGTTPSQLIRIEDDDSRIVSISAETNSIWEGENLVLTARLTKAFTGEDIEIPFALSGTAEFSSDYVVNASFIFAAGETISTEIIYTTDDTKNESLENITVKLSPIDGAQAGRQTSVSISIKDNDPIARFYERRGSRYYLLSDFSDLTEGSSDSITAYVGLSAPSNHPVTIDLQSTGTARSSDYSVSPSNLVIQPGDKYASFVVRSKDDSNLEGRESIQLSLGGITGVDYLKQELAKTELGGLFKAALEDDEIPQIEFDKILDFKLDESVAAFTFRLSSGYIFDTSRTVPVLLTFSGSATIQGNGDRPDYSVSPKDGKPYLVNAPTRPRESATQMISYAPPGVGLIGNFYTSINIFNDDSYEGTETIRIHAQAIDPDTGKLIPGNEDWITFRIYDEVDYWGEKKRAADRWWDEKIGNPTKTNLSNLQKGFKSLFNGYISDASVFVDANFNGIRDFLDSNSNGIQDLGETSEPFATTRENGSLLIDIDSAFDANGDGIIDYTEAQYVHLGGIDVSTGLTSDISFTAPPEYLGISPVSTLVSQVLQQADVDLEVAEQRVQEALGISPGPLRDVDALYQAAEGDEFAATVFAKGVQIHSTAIAVGTFISQTSGAFPLSFTGQRVFANMASKLLAQGSSLDLSEDVVIRSVIFGVGAELGLAIDPTRANALAAVIANLNASIEALPVEGSLNYLESVVKAKVVAQGELPAAIIDASQSKLTWTELTNEFSGLPLESRITVATVGNILPVRFAVSDAEVIEGNSGQALLQFEVLISNAPNAPITVDYRTLEPAASQGDPDFEPSFGTLTWERDDATSRIVTVPIPGDTILETNEDVLLQLYDPVGGSIDRAIGYGTILNDDDVAIYITDGSEPASLELVFTEDGVLLVDENGQTILDGSVGTGEQLRIIGNPNRPTTLRVNWDKGSVTDPIDIFFEGRHPDDALSIQNRNSRVTNHFVDGDSGYYQLDEQTISYTSVMSVTDLLTPAIEGIPLVINSSNLQLHATLPTIDANDGVTYRWQVVQEGVVLSVANTESAGLTIPHSGRAEITLEISAEGRATSRQTIAIDVNSPPVANDDHISTTEDDQTTIRVFEDNGNGPDFDPNGNLDASLTVNLTSPTNGTLINIMDGTFSFDPNGEFDWLAPGQSQNVSFSYQISDDRGEISSASVFITIMGVDDAPVSENGTAVATEDGAIITGHLIADDVDSDDDATTLAFLLVTGTDEGTVIVNSDGSFSFDPGADFQDLAVGETRDVSFTFHATDRHGAVSNVSTVVVTVTGVNDTSVSYGGSAVAAEDGALVSGQLVADDVDSDDDASTLAYALIDGPSEGTVTVNPDGSFSFDPGSAFQDLAAGETRDVSFTFTATDSHGAVSNVSTVTITVTGMNDAPVSHDGTSAATEDGAIVNGQLIADDVDSDDNVATLAYTLVDGPSEGIVIVNLDGSFSFDPGVDFQNLAVGETRDVSFTFHATDRHGAVSNVSTVTITVTGVNDTPVSNDGTSAATEDGAAISGQLVASDVDSDDNAATLAYALVDGPSEGKVTVNPDGSFRFDPGSDFQDLAAGETRDVSFRFTATDSHAALSNVSTVTITVTGVNDAPIVINPLANVAVSQGAIDVLVDISTVFGDIDGPFTLSATSGDDELVVASVNGTVLTLSFPPSFSGVATIDVTANDGSGGVTNTSFDVAVNNVAPDLADVTTSAAVLEKASANGRVSVGGTLIDLGLDTHRVTVNWGDGTIEDVTVDHSANSFSGTHDYATGGLYTVVVLATDSNGAVSAEYVSDAFVEGIGVVDGTLFIIGTNGRDDVKLKIDQKKDQLTVDAKFGQDRGDGRSDCDHDNGFDRESYRIRLATTASDIERVVAFLRDGDDKYDGGGSDGGDHPGRHDDYGINIRQLIFGGNGNDDLSGGRWMDAIFGGPGRDKISGRTGDDILVGGDGCDDIKRGRGSDLLISGMVDNDFEVSSILDEVDAAMAEWASGNLADTLSYLGPIISDRDERFYGKHRGC